MSASFAQTRASAERAGCVARLIPGQAAAKKPVRKPVRSVGVNEPTSRFAEETSHKTKIADLFLPSPFGSTDRWELACALAVDYALILAGWSVALFIEVLSLKLKTGSTAPALLARRIMAAAFPFAVLATLLGYSEGLYRPRSRQSQKQQTAILFKSVVWSTVLMTVYARVVGTDIPNIRLLLASTVCFLGLLAWRASNEAGRVTASRPSQMRNVLIIGAGSAGREVADYLACHTEMRRTVRGFLDESTSAGFGVLGHPSDLASIARAQFADEIILMAPQRRDLTHSIIRVARENHLDLKIVPDLFGCDPHDRWIEHLGSVPLVTLHREELPAGGLFLKRGVDMLLSAVALLVLTPLMLVIGGLIRLDSRGPVFYAALRAGRKGRPFRCFKFRTMVTNANELKDQLRHQNQRQGPCFKIAQDPRITRIGRWLRRYSLDELPQLWNVLTSDMSLVGPRPHPLDDFARYELEHLRRLDVTPGITGLWQIKARQSPSFQANMALDLEYIEHWSFCFDLRILAQTLVVVMRGTGS